MDPVALGLVVVSIAVVLVAWLGYQLFVQNGRILLRLEELEQRLERLQRASRSGSEHDTRDFQELIAAQSTLSIGSRQETPQNRQEQETTPEKRPIRLNLGCGGDIRPGWVNHDRTMHEGTDVAWDLRHVPWPIEDDTCDDVLARDVIEHLPDVVPFMDECWRVLKPDGTLTIGTALAGSKNHWTDPTHFRGFLPESFDYFDPTRFWGATFGRWYTSRYWKVEVADMRDAMVVAVLRPRKP